MSANEIKLFFQWIFCEVWTAEIIQVELHLNTNFGEYLLLLHRADLHLSVFYAKQQRFYGGKKLQWWDNHETQLGSTNIRLGKLSIGKNPPLQIALEFSNFFAPLDTLKMWSKKSSKFSQKYSKSKCFCITYLAPCFFQVRKLTECFKTKIVGADWLGDCIIPF